MSHGKSRGWPEFIKEFRKRHGLTQEELATELEISVRNIQNWETGINKPPNYLKKALEKLNE